MQAGIGGLLAERARISPELEAIVDVASGRRLTFADLDRDCRALARVLAPVVAPGDRVALLLANGPLYAALVFAVARLGGIVVPLNWRLTVPELAYQLEDCAPVIGIHDAAHAAMAAALGDVSGRTRWIAATDAALALDQPPVDGAAAADTRPVGAADGALILYTSGTTGRPKGALHTHGSSLAWCASSLASFENRFGDRQLLVAPMFHIAGICVLFNAAHRGMTLIVADGFDPGAAWRLIEAEQVTSMFAVPTMINMMREHEARLAHSHASLRWIMCGAAPVPVTLIDAYGELGIDIHQVYGSTEVHGGVAVLPPAYAHSRKGSTGLPCFGVELKVVDQAGRDVAPGERGELVSRGPHVFREYWGQPEATRNAFRDGWFLLGDIADADEDGFITIRDRSKDMIISGGENVYPAEVEDVLMRHPGVLEAAVVGEADDRWGERPMAFVVRRGAGAADEALLFDELAALCAERLGAFKRPKRFALIAELPRNASGKVLKHVLRAQLSSRR